MWRAPQIETGGVGAHVTGSGATTSTHRERARQYGECPAHDRRVKPCVGHRAAPARPTAPMRPDPASYLALPPPLLCPMLVCMPSPLHSEQPKLARQQLGRRAHLVEAMSRPQLQVLLLCRWRPTRARQYRPLSDAG
eukprot:2782272-Prymnesium_polylepis.1